MARRPMAITALRRARPQRRAPELDDVDGAVWIDAPRLDGVAFLVHPLNRPGYLEAAASVAQDSEEARLAGQGAAIARHLLRGWRGLDQAYSPEVASELFANPEYEDLVTEVHAAAHLASGKRLGSET